MGRDQVLRMTASMRQNFANVGLPYAFTDQGLVANTMDAHRVLAWCGSPEAQDKAVEVIFNGYFAEERAPNDRALLIEACVAAGKSEADARAFLDDKSAMRDQVQRELQEARGVRGVPHFVIRQPGKDPVQISGAQPPDVFERALVNGAARMLPASLAATPAEREAIASLIGGGRRGTPRAR